MRGVFWILPSCGLKTGPQRNHMATTKSTPIVQQFGLMWARNDKNLAALPPRRKGGQGVYILYDGSMPIYAGRGGFRNRINEARRSIKRAQMWDHFSWFSVKDRRKHHDLEMLMLQALPPMLRSMNRCDGKFVGSKKSQRQPKPQPDAITRKLKRKYPNRKTGERGLSA
jgi:hypothetical protein